MQACIEPIEIRESRKKPNESDDVVAARVQRNDLIFAQAARRGDCLQIFAVVANGNFDRARAFHIVMHVRPRARKPIAHGFVVDRIALERHRQIAVARDGFAHVRPCACATRKRPHPPLRRNATLVAREQNRRLTHAVQN